MGKKIILKMLGQIQLYGLVFLLGSFTVASLSDLKRMAAQKDFAEVWVLFTLMLFAYDFYLLSEDSVTELVFTVKWVAIGGFALLSWKYLHVFFALSFMDIAALSAVASLFDPIYIMLYYVLLFVVKELSAPILSKFGDGGAYPFLPVVWLTTTLMLAVVWTGGLKKIVDSAIQFS